MSKSIFEKHYSAIQSLFHKLNDADKLNPADVKDFNKADKGIISWYEMNYKNKIINILFPAHFDSQEFKNAFEEFLKYRHQRKKPVDTDIAKKKLINKLSTLSNNNCDVAIKIIDRTIENTWTGLFSLSTDTKQIVNEEKTTSYNQEI